MTCYVVVGGFFGDEGKGKIVAYLALNSNVNAAVRVGSINAGHTVTINNKEIKLRIIPSAFINNYAKLYIAAGANISPSVFLKEVELTNTYSRVWIDYNTSIIDQEHVERDRASQYLKEKIGTTGSGVGPAVEDRVKRIAKTAREIDELKPFTIDVAQEVNRIIDDDGTVIIEGTQGTYLSLYHGTYPYVTSRDTTASGICSEAGIGPKRVDEVIVVFKSFVTRVGGGPLEGELSEEEAIKRGWLEIATVTGRKRRSAPFNFNLAKRSVMINSATQIALTKLDSIFPEVRGLRSYYDLPLNAKKFIEEIENTCKVPVTIIGTGPDVHDTIDRRRELKLI
jgi:adenylosuccinate synthase